ncbi:MAG: hypothetical protein ACI814_004782 [Mariniblastus sp.]
MDGWATTPLNLASVTNTGRPAIRHPTWRPLPSPESGSSSKCQLSPPEKLALPNTNVRPMASQAMPKQAWQKCHG